MGAHDWMTLDEIEDDLEPSNPPLAARDEAPEEGLRPDPPPYRDGAEQLDAQLGQVALQLEAYIARHQHRLVDLGGQLDDLHVSLREVGTVLGLALQPGAGSERKGIWRDLAQVRADLAGYGEALTAREGATYQLGAPVRLPLEELRAIAALGPDEMALLVAAAAPSLSIDLARLYGFAWADFAIKRPTVGFLSELVGGTPERARDLVAAFRDGARLVRHGLVRCLNTPAWGPPTPLLHRAVHVPEQVIAFLSGQPASLPSAVSGAVVLRAATDAPRRDRLALDEAVVARLRSLLAPASAQGGGRPRLFLLGPPGSGRRSIMAALAAELGQGTLTVRVDGLGGDPATLEAELEDLLREALLRQLAVVIRADGVDADSERARERVGVLARALAGHDGLVVLTAQRRVGELAAAIPELHELTFELPRAHVQRALWLRTLKEAGAGGSDLAETMTQRIHVAPGRIVEAVAQATEDAHPGARQRPAPLGAAELTAAIRRREEHLLAGLAEPLGTSLAWEEAVLPPPVEAQLREVLHNARFRERVFDAWGFRAKVPYGHGLSCLFSGPPGTGKTMMASVLAGALGREIYRIDLSRVVSKWIGETEKNLARAFDEAERAQVVLLFDEADALFGKRSAGASAQDRFANMEVNYLLQKMEAYDGMTILTTNHEQNLDQAFKRRLRFRIHFPMPDGELRERLWRSLIPAAAKVEDDIRYDSLGREFELSGANIRNAVLRAAFAAAADDRPIAQRDLTRAAVAEARAMGMAVRDEPRE